MNNFEVFLKKVRTQIITDNISMICLILCILSVGISFVLLIGKLYHFLFFCLVAFMLFAGLLYYFRKKYNSKIENRWEFVLENPTSFDEMKQQLETFSDKSYFNNENCCIYLLKQKRQEYRILLYATDDFTKKNYYNVRKNANKEFNKKYSCNSSGSISKVSKRNCINIAFVNKETEALEKMLEIPADNYINRANPLLSVAVVEDKLYIPYYIGYHFVASSIYYELCNEVFKIFDLKKD